MITNFENILNDTITKVMREEIDNEVVNKAERGIFPDHLWDKLDEVGVMTVCIPENNGGAGFSIKDAFNIIRIAGKYTAPIPLAETLVGNWMLHQSGIKIGSGPLSIASPKHSHNIKFTEGQKDSLINGNAKRVPFGRYVNRMIVFGRDRNNEAMISVIDSSQIELSNGRNLAGEARDDIHLKEVYVSKNNYKKISEENLKEFDRILTLTRVCLMAGALEKVMEMTIRYAKEREQFGRPIGKFQAIKQQLAVMASQVSSAITATEYAIDSLNGKLNLESEVMVAKVRVGEAVGIVAPIAHQVHAAIGFTYEHPLHHCTRRLWSWRDECGSESEYALKLGRSILENSANSLWSIITLSKC